MRPAASQPLSTLERNCRISCPLSGICRSRAPVRSSYQLKNIPDSSCTSIPASVLSSRASRSWASSASTRPRSRAATVHQSRPPMFVGDV
jgi:hypothetical protein